MLISVLIFTHSWNSEGKSFVLLRCEFKDVIGIQISNKPYKDDDSKGNKARTVFHGCKKWKQKNPEDNIIGIPNKPEWVNERLLN